MIAFDVETTGLTPGISDVIEVAAVKFDPSGREIDSFCELAHPGQAIPHFITEMTGISDQMVSRARPSAAVMRDVVQWIGIDCFLIAHNASFDLKFLKLHIGEPRFPVVDTLRWARQLNLPTRDHKLPTLLRFIKYDPGGSHRALADARGVVQLVATFLREYEEPRPPLEIIEDYVLGGQSRRKTQPTIKVCKSKPKESTSLTRRSPDIMFVGIRGDERVYFQTLAQECGLKCVLSPTQGLAFVVVDDGEAEAIAEKVKNKDQVKFLSPDKFRAMAEYMVQKGTRVPSQVRCPKCKQFMHIRDGYVLDKGRCVKCSYLFSLSPAEG